MVNTSATLQGDVERELRGDPSVKSEMVGVTVNGEVVQLDGTVDSLWEKWAAEDAALRVRNVKSVANDLKVNWPSSKNRADPRSEVNSHSFETYFAWLSSSEMR